MNNYSEFILHLSLIDGVGPVAIEQIRQLLTRYSIEDLYLFSAYDFVQNGILPAISKLISAGLKDYALLEKELILIKKNSVQWTAIGCNDYPQLLASIYAPPALLYWYGSHPGLFINNCAVVGSRQATTYGVMVVDYLVDSLIAHDITVVSGGAFGIDAAAHKKTLALNGKTMVVVGAGLLHPYPLPHKDLFKKIVDLGGSVLSIFALDTKPHAGNFPARNRVISGLSQACVVIQAAEKSGALITANHALEQGRSIFVVPGSIFEPLYKGCHLLVNNGASLMIDPADVINSFGIKNKKNVHITLDVEKSLPQDPLHNNIFKLCLKNSLSVDELVVKTGVSLFEIQTALFEMQLTDHIRETVGGRWIAQV